MENVNKELDELFPGWEPVEIEDDEGIDFDKPVKGKYMVRFVGIERYEGDSKNTGDPYDFVSLKMQITEDISGDNGCNRYLTKTYSCIDGKYATAKEDLEKLLNDLFTAGVLKDLGITNGGIDGILEVSDQLVDKTACVSCWETKKGNQVVKIVVRHKVSVDDTSTETNEFEL